MHDADGQFIAVGRGFFLRHVVFNLFLGEAGHGVEVGALGERIVVAESNVPAVEVDIFRVVHVAVGDLALESAFADRVVHAEAQAVAAHVAVGHRIGPSSGDVGHAAERDASASRGVEVLIVKVLNEGKSFPTLENKNNTPNGIAQSQTNASRGYGFLKEIIYEDYIAGSLC